MQPSSSKRILILLTPPLLLNIPLSLLVIALERIASSITSSHQARFDRYGGTPSFDRPDTGAAVPILTYGAPTSSIIGACVVALAVGALSWGGIYELRKSMGSSRRYERVWAWSVIFWNLFATGLCIGVLGWVSSVVGGETGWATKDDMTGSATSKDESTRVRSLTRETWTCSVHSLFGDRISWAGSVCGLLVRSTALLSQYYPTRWKTTKRANDHDQQQAARFLLIPIAVSLLLTVISMYMLARDRGGIKWLFGGAPRYNGFDSIYEMNANNDPRAGPTPPQPPPMYYPYPPPQPGALPYGQQPPIARPSIQPARNQQARNAHQRSFPTALVPGSSATASSSGGIILDSKHRGCIVTPPNVTQWQCDEGNSGTPGWSFNCDRELVYHGSPALFACPVNDRGEWNVYVKPDFGQKKCVPITLLYGGDWRPAGCHSKPSSMSSSKPSSKQSSRPPYFTNSTTPRPSTTHSKPAYAPLPTKSTSSRPWHFVNSTTVGSGMTYSKPVYAPFPTNSTSSRPLISTTTGSGTTYSKPVYSPLPANSTSSRPSHWVNTTTVGSGTTYSKPAYAPLPTKPTSSSSNSTHQKPSSSPYSVITETVTVCTTTTTAINTPNPLPGISTPGNLTTSPDGTCGKGTDYSCLGFTAGTCCSHFGWCGSSRAFCGVMCQSSYGTCGSSA
ncbi:unnamed protein product [Periconia digitata]|uniref:Chitin-binding type-1 domain-containing protein n=1 Tax=Periconia digitata TaxID=1303443 RepID=A0A9W4UXZ7_9PLEO|nr:unnamed protein product [Periconia digitata]